ncbi:hypothetical protein JCM1841_000850 [Sporobolomyces salmonicolor]
MLPSKRRPPALPTTRSPFPPPSSSSASSTYKDKSLRPPSLRLRLRHLLTRPLTLASLFLGVFVAAAYALGLIGASGETARMRAGERVIARDWNTGGLGATSGIGAEVRDEQGELLLSAREYNETVLILCPMRNSLEHIWHFFHLLDSLTYPHHLLQLGILVSDSSDRTYARALELADERQFSRAYRGRRFGRVSVFSKDFADGALNDGETEGEEDGDEGSGYRGENVGKERHDYSVQIGRRKLLAKSRTWLLNAAMAPEVDWVLWLDVDVVDYEPAMVERLLGYAKGELPGAGNGQADVVVPNCVWKTYNEMGPYDRNNWLETPESVALKRTLSPSSVLIEGYKDHPTHRLNLASLVPASPQSLSPSNPYLASSPLLLSTLPSPPLSHHVPLLYPSASPDPALDPDTAHVPEIVRLDGVGGCAALVRAEVHREGAVFPSWVVEHQLETEGFAQLVKKVRRGRGGGGAEARGRMLGLPTYYVYHGLYG